MNPSLPKRPSVDLSMVRQQLQGARGRQLWRSLEDVAQTPEFEAMLHREFPAGASEWWDGVSRRNFLKMAAASLALAGLNGCTKQPVQEILPYVNQPELLVPGEALWYATAMPFSGFCVGVVVKSREGHPIKVDGNPSHPSSLGGSSVWMQASILDLYDPDRSQAVTRSGQASSWAAFLSELNALRNRLTDHKGEGFAILTETVTSPTLAAQIQEVLQRFPRAKWHQYDPVARDNVRQGAHLAFGEVVEAHHHFGRAEVVVALDSDFLYTHPQRLRYARQFTDARRVAAGQPGMNRLYVAEPSPTITGSMAEHRLPIASGELAELARTLLQAANGSLPEAKTDPRRHAWLKAASADLQAHRGAGVVIAGEWQPPVVHALAHLLNERLGNVGKTVTYAASAEAEPVSQLDSIRELAEAMEAGAVQTLLILSGNPVYSAPVDLNFGAGLTKVDQVLHLGLEADETAALATWHIPQAHYLESWGDLRAFDGTVSLVQPLIAPLYDGKSAHQLLGALLQPELARSDYDLVREFWREQNRDPEFEQGWRRALHDGLVQGTAFASKQLQAKTDAIEAAAAQIASTAGRIELNFRPDPSVWDGRFANNGWLQECPRPISKLTWDNAALVSPALAEESRLSNGDVIEIRSGNHLVRVPAWITPGQVPGAITLHLGYGRKRTGRVGAHVGFDVTPVRTSSNFWRVDDVTLAKTLGRHQLVATQTHHNLHSPERQIYRQGTWQQFQEDPEFVQHSSERPERDTTLYDPAEFQNAGYQWGMSIDLTTCLGCNACLLACEVENNIPVVGKDQVARNREMFWIRVDTYYRGSLDNPEFSHMPVPCMHCEHAPCELVCPVEATVHDHEGLNLQVYNRCVGTRFCSNNCPYKVRRFNFLFYSDYETPSYKPLYNPEVTVRWRGVMEKCTYCVQRISAARIVAEKEDRRVRDQEVQTACQQACPANAIVFGDLTDPNSAVSKLKRHALDYSMLGELNTRPRTTYLAKLNNPNPDATI